MTQIDRNSTAAALATLEAQIADLKRKLDAASKPKAGAPEVEAAVKRAGHLTVAQVMAACNLQKSSAWHHINALERQGKVWLRQTHRADGRKHTLVYHADAIVT